MNENLKNLLLQQKDDESVAGGKTKNDHTWRLKIKLYQQFVSVFQTRLYQTMNI